MRNCNICGNEERVLELYSHKGKDYEVCSRCKFYIEQVKRDTEDKIDRFIKRFLE